MRMAAWGQTSGAHAAVDADGRIPDRDLHGNTAFLNLRRAGRETSRRRGRALTGSRSPLPAIIMAVTRCDELVAAVGDHPAGGGDSLVA